MDWRFHAGAKDIFQFDDIDKWGGAASLVA